MKVTSQHLFVKSTLCLILLFFSFNLTAQETETTEESVLINENDPDLQWGPCPEFMPEGCQIAVLHGDPAERNADIYFKIPANSEVPEHTHTSAERMILVSGELEVNYEGEQPKTLRPGSYAYGPAEKPHSASCGDTPCVLFIAFEEPVDAFAVSERN